MPRCELWTLTPLLFSVIYLRVLSSKHMILASRQSPHKTSYYAASFSPERQVAHGELQHFTDGGHVSDPRSSELGAQGWEP